jgi:hypothetical protein
MMRIDIKARNLARKAIATQRLMNHSAFPTEAGLPESVELIHCTTAERLVAIRLASGAVLELAERAYTRDLPASESAVSYTRTADAMREADDRVDAETERQNDLAEAERVANQAELLKLENDVSTWKQRAADLADELARVRRFGA